MRTTPNPEIISWAIARAGKEPRDFRSISAYAELWATGEKTPTVKHMQKLAAKTHVPLPYFYDDHVPSMSLQIPDFRTTFTGSAENPSPELYETINLMQTRQDWLSAYLFDSGAEELGFIGICADDRDAKRAAAMIRSILALYDGWARSLKADEAVRSLRASIESIGVYTCAGSFFHHSSRPYDLEEFRGFVLVNEYAPIIFLNTQGSTSAQLFTLIHEFAHLLFNESGVDDVAYELPEKEDLCDTVAAEVLVPSSLVFSTFDRLSGEQAIGCLRASSKASEMVCLRRAHELGCITEDVYDRIYRDYKRTLEEPGSSNQAQAEEGGPSFHVVQKHRLGQRFSDAVLEGVTSERLLFSDAYRLTDMKARDFDRYYEEEGKCGP